VPKITEMFAFIIEDAGPGDEGVVAFSDRGIMMPMVGADTQRAQSLKPMARLLSRKFGKPIKLIHFTERVEVETITGGEH